MMTRNILAYAMQTAQLLEYSGHPPEALTAYQLIGRRYQDDERHGLGGRRETQRRAWPIAV